MPKTAFPNGRVFVLIAAALVGIVLLTALQGQAIESPGEPVELAPGGESSPTPLPTTASSPAPGADGYHVEAAILADREAAAGPELPGDPTLALPTEVPREAAPAELRVGLQVGHWRSAELPDELARLRTSVGAVAGGVVEWELNLDIAGRVAARLEAEGIVVDVIPATVPPGYHADAFVALHADGDATGRLSGFKLARARWSATPAEADALIAAITAEYAEATGLPLDHHITRNMTGYYAFNYRRFVHAVSPATPAVILEMGFLTSAADRRVLLGAPDTVAEGIVRGILAYLAAGGKLEPGSG